MQKPWRGGVKSDKSAPDNESSGDERTTTTTTTRGGRGGGGGGGAAEILSRMSEGENSDEDTEDARSSDEAEYPKEDSADIKEQMYQDKLNSLKTQLKRLEDGSLPEYTRKLRKLEMAYNESCRIREVAAEYERQQIENDYKNEIKSAVKELEERKVELRETLIGDLEEKKRQIEAERQSFDLNGPASSIRMMTSDTDQKPVTRTLRKRHAEARNAQTNSKRGKNGHSSINTLLEEEEIADDLKQIQKLTSSSSSSSRPSASNSSSAAAASSTASTAAAAATDNFSSSATSAAPPPSSSSSSTSAAAGANPASSGVGVGATSGATSGAAAAAAPSLAGVRIENGKLFYDKKWFHRGQPVYLEANGGEKEQAVIMAIGAGNQDVVTIRKVEDRTKTKIHLAQLTKQKFVIRKRTA